MSNLQPHRYFSAKLITDGNINTGDPSDALQSLEDAGIAVVHFDREKNSGTYYVGHFAVSYTLAYNFLTDLGFRVLELSEESSEITYGG